VLVYVCAHRQVLTLLQLVTAEDWSDVMYALHPLSYYERFGAQSAAIPTLLRSAIPSHSPEWLRRYKLWDRHTLGPRCVMIAYVLFAVLAGTGLVIYGPALPPQANPTSHTHALNPAQREPVPLSVSQSRSA
jgi:hypothetical protein